MKRAAAPRQSLVIVPAQLDNLSGLPSVLEEAGFTVRRAGDQSTLIGLLDEADVLVTYVNLRVDREQLAAAPRLRGVVSLVIGVDVIDVRACTELGIVVANGAVPEIPVGMAEAAVMLIAVLIKGLKRKENTLRAGGFRPEGSVANLVWRKTVGIVGVGRIGRGVAQRLQGWDVNLLGYSPHLTSEAAPQGMQAVSLEELLRDSDIVSVHAPLTAETRGLIGARELALMKPEAYLVNTGRGGVVDELALAEALRSDRLAGAAIDVWPQEPPPQDHPLFSLASDRPIFTGHCVGHGDELVPAMLETAVENVRRVARGDLPLNTVNPEVTPAWEKRISALDGQG